MSYADGIVSKEFLKEIIDETIEDEVYAGVNTIPLNTTTPLKVKDGTIAAGFDAVILGLAAEQSDSIFAWIKRKDKQVFADGLNSGGLNASMDETPLYVKLGEKDAWELGFTNTSGGNITINWRLRIRKVKKA